MTIPVQRHTKESSASNQTLLILMLNAYLSNGQRTCGQHCQDEGDENEIKFTNDTSICRRVFFSFFILDKVSFSVCGLSFLGCQGMLFTRNGRSRVKYLPVSHPVIFVFSNCPN